MRVKWVVAVSCGLLAAASLLGCATPKGSDIASGEVSYYLEEQREFSLGKVVVSVPRPDSQSTHQNLHIVLDAIVNQKRGWSDYASPAASFLRRLQPRIADRIVGMVGEMGAVSATSLPEIRKKAIAESEKVVAEALSHWKHAKDVEIKVFVTSIYLTDPSVAVVDAPSARYW